MKDVARWPTQIGSLLLMIGLWVVPPLAGMRVAGSILGAFGAVCLLTSLALVAKERGAFYAKASLLLLAVANAVPFAVQRRWIEGSVGLGVAGIALVATVVFAALSWRKKVMVFTKDVVVTGLLIPAFAYTVLYTGGANPGG